LDKQDIIQLFIEEAVEHINEVSNQLMALESDPTNPDIIQVLFRSAHTLKGNSTTAYNTLLDFDADEKTLLHIKNIGKITHAFENLIMEARDSNLPLTPDRIELLFETETIVETLISYVEQEVQEDLDVEELSEKLLQSVKDEGATPVIIKETKTDFHYYGLTLDCDEGFKHAFLSMVYRDIQDKYDPSDEGKIVRFNPSFDDLMEGKEFTKIFFELDTSIDTNEVLSFVKGIDTVKSITLLDNKPSSSEQPKEEVPAQVLEAIEVQKAKPAPVSANASKKEPAVKKNLTSSTNIRVDIKRIDEVLKHVSSLVILKNKLSTYTSLLSDEDVKILKDVSEEISQTVDFLQESVMTIRMTPLVQLFQRFPTDVRNIAKEYGKKVAFEHIGGQTEIDKSLLDSLGNPLMHLIRNSVFHGLESEEERLESGKDPIGKLTLSAGREQGFVIITVEDDGRGIDTEKVIRKAVEKGILSEEKAKTIKDEEAVQLIYHSGLSTADKVTSVAGRGVGMDAVKAIIEEEMKGSVHVYSTLGHGTKTVIRLPLTLAIINAMRTKINGEDFAFPTNQVEEVVAIHPKEIKYIANKEVYILREKEIPVIRLKEYFGLDAVDEEDKMLNMVILKLGERTVAAAVDEFVGQEDIVVKNIGKYLGNIPGISGCNILGDGSICLIVDVNTLFNK